MKAILGLVAALALSNAAHAGAAAVAKMIDLNGSSVGQTSFKSTPHGVLIEIAVKGLTPGAHAVMLHMTGACDPDKQFASAGPDFSFDPTRPHGYFAKGGPRAGDLPNQFAAADGTLHATMLTTAFSLGDGAKSIFDRDGVSIIVHGEPDDYLSQPDGHAGTRVMCGTIMRTIAPGSKGKKRR